MISCLPVRSFQGQGIVEPGLEMNLSDFLDSKISIIIRTGQGSSSEVASHQGYVGVWFGTVQHM